VGDDARRFPFRLPSPPKFDGDLTQITAETWLAAIGQWLTVVKVPPKECAGLAAMHLDKGPLANWLNHGTHEERQRMSWEDFGEWFRALYIPHGQAMHARDTLYDLRQNGAPILQHVNNFETLAARIPDLSLTEKTSLFMRTLDSDLRKALAADPKTGHPFVKYPRLRNFAIASGYKSQKGILTGLLGPQAKQYEGHRASQGVSDLRERLSRERRLGFNGANGRPERRHGNGNGNGNGNGKGPAQRLGNRLAGHKRPRDAGPYASYTNKSGVRFQRLHEARRACAPDQCWGCFGRGHTLSDCVATPAAKDAMPAAGVQKAKA
jgi:hypothetical protein